MCLYSELIFSIPLDIVVLCGANNEVYKRAQLLEDRGDYRLVHGLPR